jgi:hypothetical protein
MSLGVVRKNDSISNLSSLCPNKVQHEDLLAKYIHAVTV